MYNKREVEEEITRFMAKLALTGVEAMETGEYSLAWERIKGLKDEAVKFLLENVSEEEAKQLDKQRDVLISGSLKQSCLKTINVYQRYLQALFERIFQYPSTVLDKPMEPKEAIKKPGQVSTGKRVFVVHGANQAIKEQMARFLERLELEPIILHEQPNKGRTIIEKFEDYSQVAFAIVLLTGDDIGSLLSEEDEFKPRARQNVVFELGFFTGKLGRNRVCALYEKNVELPSDFKGVVYIPLDKEGGWKLSLARELKAVGLKVNLDKVV